MARARQGLLWLKKGHVPAAMRELQCLAEVDAQELGFLLQRLEASERQSLSQVCPTEPPPSASPARWARGCSTLPACLLSVEGRGGGR